MKWPIWGKNTPHEPAPPVVKKTAITIKMVAEPVEVVAVFLNPVTGKAQWQVDPPPGYKEHGSGEFHRFVDEFPFVQPTGWPEEDFGKVFRSQAIAAAKSLYWSLVAPK